MTLIQTWFFLHTQTLPNLERGNCQNYTIADINYPDNKFKNKDLLFEKISVSHEEGYITRKSI